MLDVNLVLVLFNRERNGERLDFIDNLSVHVVKRFEPVEFVLNIEVELAANGFFSVNHMIRG